MTDVYEDACVWVRDREDIASVQVHCLGSPTESDEPVELPLDKIAPLNSYCAIYELFQADNAVGNIVFTHADGRQAQITRQDFGL